MTIKYSQFHTLIDLRGSMEKAGVIRLFFKTLGKNNNDKQQIYIATDMSKISFLPTGEMEAARSKSTKNNPKGKAIFRTCMPLDWLNSDGSRCTAPSTKLIFYPQYPEVRISGFLEKCELAPNELLSRAHRGKETGRILFLGVTHDGRVLAHAVAPESSIAKEIRKTSFPITHGVLKEILINEAVDSRQLLLSELARIHRMGWVDGVKLTREGMESYDKKNSIGYTLEAHLGILPNGNAKPDFHGWEVKGTTIKDFGRKMSLKVSVLTGSPTAGLIREIGWREFVMRYGYRNNEKPPGRIDFNGVHRYGIQQNKTGLILDIEGYKDRTIVDEQGGVIIADNKGKVILKWHFSKLMEHWKKKHTNAVFVPALSRAAPRRQFWFSRNVKLGTGTEFYKLLDAIKAGSVVYDSGLWVNPQGETTKQRGHERHQIRVIPSQVSSLYSTFEDVDVTAVPKRPH